MLYVCNFLASILLPSHKKAYVSQTITKIFFSDNFSEERAGGLAISPQDLVSSSLLRSSNRMLNQEGINNCSSSHNRDREP